MQKIEIKKKEFKVITLPSGVKCVHRKIEGPVAYFSLTIGAGTRNESEKQHGVAHLVEHLLFKGTKNFRSYYINSALDSVGGELNAFTSKEETVLHATCAVQYALKGAKLLCDMAFNSLFDTKEIEKEKEVVIDEINSYKDTPSELIFDEFEELLFAGSSLGRNILGDKRSVKKVKREDLVNYCSVNYLPENMVFAMYSPLGDKEFEKLCSKVFVDLPSKDMASCEGLDVEASGVAEGVEKKVSAGGVVSAEADDKGDAAIPRVPMFDVVRKRRVAQCHIVMGGYAPSVFDEGRLAAALLINIIGGPSALSRMNMILREKHALTYNAEAAYCPFSDTGFFTLYYSCEASRMQRAEDLLLRELKSFVDEELSRVKLAKYKKQFAGQLLIANQNSEGAMLATAKSLLVYGKVEHSDTVVDKIEAITAEDIRNVAREMFATDNLYKLSYI
ncbi:MAG: pitrilysin family protein [Rikenellaceae bacterium]